MSYKYGSALVSGAYHYGGGGLGVLGSAVPATGDSGAAYLFNDLSLPADASKEIRGEITSPPAAGTWYAWEDGSFTLTGAPDGVYAFSYRLYVDGADLGTVSSTITVGVAPAGGLFSGTAVLGDLVTGGGFGGELVLGSLSGTTKKSAPVRTNRQTATR